MQKKLIALAVAGIASTGAFAQANVTISGTMDIYLMTAQGTSKGVQGGFGAAAETGVGFDGINTAAATGRGAQNFMGTGGRSTSLISFKGTEDLGGGLKAGFNVTTAITPDGGTGQAVPAASTTSGAGIFGGRESTLSLSGGFGVVTAGRQAFVTDITGAFDATADKIGGISQYTFSPLTTRYNNAIRYDSPNLSGFVVSYQINMSENQGNVVTGTGGGTVTGITLKYNAGPIAVAFAQSIGRDYASGTVPNTVAANAAAPMTTALGKTATVNTLGGSYDFGVAKLMGNYMTTRNTTAGSEVARTIDATTWNLGVTAPMGAHLFRVNYVSTNDKRTNDADATAWTLGYDYALSKRTSAYLGAATVSNKNGATFSANTNTTASMTGVTRDSQTGATLATAPQGGRTNAYFAGILHTF